MIIIIIIDSFLHFASFHNFVHLNYQEQRGNMHRILGLKVLSSFQFSTKIICYDIAITIILVYILFLTFHSAKTIKI